MKTNFDFWNGVEKNQLTFLLLPTIAYIVWKDTEENKTNKSITFNWLFMELELILN